MSAGDRRRHRPSIPTKPHKPAATTGATVDTVISVDEVNRQAAAIAEPACPSGSPSSGARRALCQIEGPANAGYGKMEILHDFNLQVGRGQSLCLIGPNGAGKSTILHSHLRLHQHLRRPASWSATAQRSGTSPRLSSNEKLRHAGIAYILQDKSVFPGMTVEENLWMGGYLMDTPDRGQGSGGAGLSKNTRAWPSGASQPRRGAVGRRAPAAWRSRGRLVMEPGGAARRRALDRAGTALHRHGVRGFSTTCSTGAGKTIVMVEQNAKKGLEFADLGYVLVSGQLAMAGTGDELLADPQVGRLFLGG